MSHLTKKLYKFDQNVLNLSKRSRKNYNRQVRNLIASLKSELCGGHGIRIKNVEVSGSFAKHTILRKMNENPIDVDLLFYFPNEQNKPPLKSLVKKIYSALITHYSNKHINDFEIHNKATTVKFRGSGLNNDAL